MFSTSDLFLAPKTAHLITTPQCVCAVKYDITVQRFRKICCYGCLYDREWNYDLAASQKIIRALKHNLHLRVLFITKTAFHRLWWCFATLLSWCRLRLIFRHKCRRLTFMGYSLLELRHILSLLYGAILDTNQGIACALN